MNKHEGPGHKQKLNKKAYTEDDQFWIDAWIDMLKNGMGVIVLKMDGPQRIAPENYTELIQSLEQVIKDCAKPE